MNFRSSRLALPTAALLALVAGSVMDAHAVGNRGGGGGAARGGDFSRSGPAASGSLSGQRGAAGTGGRTAATTGARQAGATERSGQRAATAQTASRQTGATERSGQRAETQQSRADTRTSGQQERTEREGQRQQGQTERTDARQQGQTERTESRATAAQNMSGNWDGHHYDDNDDEWGYALAGAAVGATAGYIAGAATAAPAAPAYVTVLPCTPMVVPAGGVSYYGCGGTWYNQSYVNGTVSYVTVAPPPGY